MSTVQTNLVHQQLWTDVSTFRLGNYWFCAGYPPQKLHPSDPDVIQKETVLVSQTGQSWTVSDWKNVFDLTQTERVTMAMVTNDSTVVYYLVNRGLQTPRKN